MVSVDMWVASGVVAAVLSFLLLGSFRSQKSSRVRLPPSPPGAWPILGHLPLMGLQPHMNLMKLAKTHGPLMYMRLGQVPTVIVSSKEILKEMFQVHDLIMASRPRYSANEIMAYNAQDIAGAPYGEHWRNMRKLFAQELLSMKRLQELKGVRKGEILNTVETIFYRAKQNSDSTVNMRDELKDLTFNIMTQMMISKRYFGPNIDSNINSQEFQKCVEKVLTLAAKFNIGDFVPYLLKFDLQGYRKEMYAAHAAFDKFVSKVFLEHRTNTAHKPDHVHDFVDTLLDLQRREGLHDDVIKAVLVDILMAGTETSSTTLEWLMTEFMRNPRVMMEAQKELDEVVGRDRLVEESDIPNLKYLIACVKETMRLHSIVPLMIPHESTASCTVAGYDLPAKVRVIVNMVAIHMDPDTYEQPEEFRPERFLDSEIDLKGQHFQLVPFGTGRRICMGMNLGLLTVQHTAAVILQTCNWRLPREVTPESMDMSETFAAVLFKTIPLKLVPTPRLRPHVYASENIKL